MIKLVVVADDFTGSLDTGIKFAQTGAMTQMMIGAEFDLSRIAEGCEVLIVDSETRHLPPEEAYAVVYQLVKRLAAFGVQMFYKKTDSALRGCIGSELTALCDALGCKVHFVPALPGENRTTVGGVQYINGIPVSKSVFGKDPFEPVKQDAVADVIREQSDISVIGVRSGFGVPFAGKRSIVVYDAETDSHIIEIACRLKELNELRAVAGCAGFANVLNSVLALGRKERKKFHKTKKVFVACGTVNQITGKQLIYAQEHGFCRVSLSVEQKLEPNYLDSPKGEAFTEYFRKLCAGSAPVVLDVFGKEDVVLEAVEYCRGHGLDEKNIRVKVAERLGEFLDKWLSFGNDDTMVLSGGDTVYGFLKRIKCDEVYPVCEVLSGAVLFLAKLKNDNRILRIVSKSGGFGSPDFFVKVAEVLTER